MNFDRIKEIIIDYDSEVIKVSNSDKNGGIDPLWSRLGRAALNQVQLPVATEFGQIP